MLLATTPLLIAAAAVAAPQLTPSGFGWLNPATAALDTAPRVFLAPTGNVLVIADEAMLYGSLGTPLTDVASLAPPPDMPAGASVASIEATGLTRGGAVILRWTIELDDGSGLDPAACQVQGFSDTWTAWDPYREIAPVTFDAPDNGFIMDLFAVNATLDAAGIVMTPDGVRGATWDAGPVRVLPVGSFAHSVCNGGWFYGVADPEVFGPVATVWAPDGAEITLGMMPGHLTSAAMCGDNGTTFGISQGELLPFACTAPVPDTLFRWTPDTGMTPFATDAAVDIHSALADLPPTPDGRFTTMRTPRDTPGPTGYLVDPIRGMIDVATLVPPGVLTQGFDRFFGLTTESVEGDVLVGVAERVIDGVPTFRAFSMSVDLSPADLVAPFFTVDLADVNAFIDGFLNGYSLGDLNLDGVFDLTDIDLFVEAYLREG